MKTASLISGLLLAILGICTTIAGINGATHQYYIAGVAFLLAIALLNEASKKDKPKNRITL